MPSLRARWSKPCLGVKYLKTVCLATVVCLSLSTLLPAQGTGGRITGRVSDPTGAVLAGVKVTATNEATGAGRDATTTESGDYVFPEMPVGVYTLSFELTGFKKEVRHGATLQVNAVITLNMVMQIGQTQEVVDVTSEAPLVDTTSTQLGAVVDDRSVSRASAQLSRYLPVSAIAAGRHVHRRFQQLDRLRQRQRGRRFRQWWTWTLQQLQRQRR